MTKISVVRNDSNFPLNFTIKDAEGDIVDLTDASPVLKVQKYNSSSLAFSVNGSVISESDGTCEFIITDEVESIYGDYVAEIEINWSSGKKLTTEQFSFKILKDLPKTR